MLAETDIFSEIDLDLEPPCEALFHEKIGATDSAAYLIRFTCESCTNTGLRQVGEECYQLAMGALLECVYCGEVGLGKDCWKIISVL